MMGWVGAAITVSCVTAVLMLTALVLQQQEANRRLVADAAHVCEQSNEARLQLNIRGEVLVQFLRSAQQARSAATVDVATNRAAAKTFGELAKRIQPLPYRDCDGDGNLDRPEGS